jgi:MFS family permease
MQHWSEVASPSIMPASTATAEHGRSLGPARFRRAEFLANGLPDLLDRSSMELPLKNNPSFTRYWIGEVSSVLAYQMLVVAIGWQIYDLTGSALSLGLVGLAHFVSQVLFSLVAGHLADRRDRRKVALVSLLLQAGVALTLAVGSFGGWMTSGLIYLGSFLIGIASTLQSPAVRALLPALVGEALLPKGIAWSAAARKAAIIVGPAVGGVVYAFGPTVVYTMSAAFFVIAGFVFLGIRVPFIATTRKPVTVEFVFGGLSYILGRPVLLGAMSLDLFAMMLGGATALLPIYAKDILETGPWGLGLLRSAPAVGALIASAYLVHRHFDRNVGPVLFGSVAVFGLATIFFGVSTSLPLSLAALAVVGAADMIGVVLRTSLVQLETPDEMRGRVSAVHSLFTGTSNQLGQFESGVTAAWWGTVPAVVVGGAGTLVVVVAWMRLFPALLKRDTLATHAP